jgi:hypothetical protein
MGGRTGFPVIALVCALGIAAVVSGAIMLVASAARPSPYPNSTFDGWGKPAVTVAWEKDCLEWITVTKGLYRSSDDPGQVLDWYKGQGWMENFRLNDSALRQSGWRVGGLMRVRLAQETYVERPRQATLILATTQMMIGLGNCR